ncbi:MAG: HIT family protein [Candidatus Diapherotrites archaeon]|nr:HIT family protein [Candidatus Diapherotrites archaeon]
MKKEKFSTKKLEYLKKSDCFICKGQIRKEDTIFENKEFIAFLDIFPPTKGYAIVAPKKHFEDITEIPEKELQKTMLLVKKVAKAIKAAYSPRRICLAQTGGLVSHFHFHVIPMYSKDWNTSENFKRVFFKEEILKFSQAKLKKIAGKIRKNLKLKKTGSK